MFLQKSAERGCHPFPSTAPRTLVPVKTTKLPSAPPMEANDVAIVTGGTVVWLVGFVVLLPFHGWLAHHGDTKWLWTCLAGFGLGLIGIWYCRARRDAIRRSQAEAQAAAAGPSAGPGAGPGTDTVADMAADPGADAPATGQPGQTQAEAGHAPGPSRAE